MIVESPRRPGPQSPPDQGAAEPPDALIEEARRWQRRRRLRLIIAVVVLAALGAAIYGGFGGSPNPPPTIPVIERNLADALAKSQTTMILRVHWHRARSPYYVTAVEWVNPANGDQRWLDYSASGRLRTDTTRSRSGKATDFVRRILTVSYDSKTSWVWTSGAACGGRECSAPPDPNAACNCDVDPITNFGRQPRFSLLGQQTIDGQRTFHLRFTITTPLPSTIDFWIDRSTYLPVHEKVVYREPSVKSHPTITVTNDFTWAPRTEADLAQLTLVIPHGFKRSKPPNPCCSLTGPG